jgi:hypothetical protein
MLRDQRETRPESGSVRAELALSAVLDVKNVVVCGTTTVAERVGGGRRSHRGLLSSQ